MLLGMPLKHSASFQTLDLINKIATLKNIQNPELKKSLNTFLIVYLTKLLLSEGIPPHEIVYFFTPQVISDFVEAKKLQGIVQ